MSHKIKSALYFVSLVLALITYYHLDNVSTTQTIELVNNTNENISDQGALN